MLHDLLATLPIWLTAIVGGLVLLLDAFVPTTDTSDRRYLGHLSAGGSVLSLVCLWLLWGHTNGFELPMFQNMMALGPIEMASVGVILIITTTVSLMATDHAEEQGFSHGELYALIHFAAFGMMVLATATHMATMFVGLEIMSISVYILAAVKRASPLGAEAGLKYFLLGALASGILLYGMAFIYGESGALDFAGIRAALAAKSGVSGYLGLGLAMVGVAFAFKIALVPFHMWTPDVYEGATPPITAFMATGVKTAGVLAMGRMFSEALPAGVIGEALDKDFVSAMALFAVLTMFVGNTVALHQKDLKRMLAYSSIAHGGYLAVGVLAAHRGDDGLGPLVFYLFTYALSNLAVFAVLTMAVKGRRESVELDDVAGLAKTNPFAALVLGVAMLSLAGVPPTAGFFGKLVLFRSALAAESVGSKLFLVLVIAAMLSSVISVYYYLRVVVAAYMEEPKGEPRPAPSRSMLAALVITFIGIIWVGVFPSKAIDASAGASATSAVIAPAAAAAPAVRAPGGPAIVAPPATVK
jgi:NADH-quinone oxidoreductase subunit N